MNKLGSDHSKERFRAAKQLMLHLVADQQTLVHAWTSGQASRLKASQKHATQRIHTLVSLMNRMKAEEQHVGKAWIQGNKKKVQHESQHTKEEVHEAQTVAKVKESGTKVWGSGAVAGQAEAGSLASQVGRQMSDSFATFGSHVAKGQMSLAQASSFLGKEILKGVLDSVATRLVNKGEMELALGAALLTGIVTAELAPSHLIAGGLMTAAGLGLQMVSAALLAQGALVVRPTLAVIGEGGQPEAVIPADRFAEFGLTGGLEIGKTKLHFPDVKKLNEANHPQFSSSVTQELQAAMQNANTKKN